MRLDRRGGIHRGECSCDTGVLEGVRPCSGVAPWSLNISGVQFAKGGGTWWGWKSPGGGGSLLSPSSTKAAPF